MKEVASEKLNLEKTSEGLEKENKQLKEERRNLEEKVRTLQEKIDSREFARNSLTWWTAKSISIVGLIYLLAVIFAPSNAKINKISNTEIFVFAIILIFNSGLFEKLEDFSVDGTKIQAKFQKLEEKQDQQKDELAKLQQQQLDLQKQQLETLTMQQTEISKLQKEQDLALGFIARHLIEGWQVDLLEKLKEAMEKKRKYDFQYTPVRGVRLRELRGRALVMNYPGKSIAEIERLKNVDLTEHFYVTKSGFEYLNLRNSLGIQINNNSPEEDIDI